MKKQKVVLDANTFYGSFTRDLLLSLFAAEMYKNRFTMTAKHFERYRDLL